MDSLPKSNLVERLTLPKEFKLYLEGQNVSPKTLANYVSDVLHFLRWARNSLGEKNIIPHLSFDLALAYKESQVQSGVPQATINRRLSSLRRFAHFLEEKNLITENPLDDLQNLPTQNSALKNLLPQFRTELLSEETNPSVAQKKIEDISEFLRFVYKEQKSSGQN